MLCRNCGRSEAEHTAKDKVCLGTKYRGNYVTSFSPAGSDYAREIRCSDEAASIQPQTANSWLPGSRAAVRKFDTGATRDQDTDKLDFEGFLSPIVLERFSQYMHKNRVQSDGSVRASDNWQRGIPKTEYMKSGWRHFFAWWRKHRAGEDATEDLCALLFNVQGYLFESLNGR